MADKRPGGSTDDSLNLVQLAMQIHAGPFHAVDLPAKSLLQDDSITPRFMAVGGVFLQADPNLANGEAGIVRMTNDGKLMVDATINIGDVTVSFGYNDGDYNSFTCTDAETHITHTFSCRELSILNDGAVSIFYDFVTPVVVATAHELKKGEGFVDSFIHTDVYFVCDTGESAAVRVWARGGI